MKLFRLVKVSILVICLCACEKDNDDFNIDCNNLVEGIINMDSDAVRKEINELTVDLEPSPTEDDNIGHRKNFDLLINHLNSSCEQISAQMICYACVKTWPVQTELKVTVDSSGVPVTRTIDITTPENNILSCNRIHEYYGP